MPSSGGSAYIGAQIGNLLQSAGRQQGSPDPTAREHVGGNLGDIATLVPGTSSSVRRRRRSKEAALAMNLINDPRAGLVNSSPSRSEGRPYAYAARSPTCS